MFSARSGETTFMAEIKTSTAIRNVDWRTLRRFVAESPAHIGLLIANTAGIERLADRVWSVPAAWLLG